MMQITLSQSNQLNRRDQSISLQLQKASCGLLALERETQPVGEWLCSLSSNQSQFTAGGASGRCEAKEYVEQAISSQRALYQICVLWRLDQVPASSTLWGHCQDMTASATHQLWSCWEKKGQNTLSQKGSSAQGNNCCSGIFNCSHNLREKLSHCHPYHPSRHS